MLARLVSFAALLSLVLLTSCSKPPADTSGDSANPGAPPPSSAATAPKPSASGTRPPATATTPAGTRVATSGTTTKVLMHNVILNERPGLTLRVRWLRGQMRPTRPGVVPSFDEPNSFFLDIQDGVIGTSLNDISGILNGGLLKGMPLSDVKLSEESKRLKLNGTLHKAVPLPVEMISDVGVSPDGRIQLHVVKLRVLKLPVKGLLQSFHISLTDVVGKGGAGVQVSGEDILIDAQQILPAPAIRGTLTAAHLGDKTGDLVTVFGSARQEVVRTKEWRNFIRLLGGTVNFGKLTMDNADLVLADASNDDWFNFDLTRYQEQLVNGKIQMTPQAGLRVFMPSIDKIPENAANRSISLQWLKNRNQAPPETP